MRSESVSPFAPARTHCGVRLRPLIQRNSQAFTRLELLVTIGILGLLFCLLMPAVTIIGRPPGRRAQCMSQLKQLGLALQNHHTRMNAFPPGLPDCRTENFHDVQGPGMGDTHAYCQGPNWLTAILPDIEEGRAWDEILQCLDDSTVRNVCADCPAKTPSAIGTETPAVLRCPSAEATGSEFQFRKSTYGLPSGSPTLKLAKGNYAACFGSKFYLTSHTEPEYAGVFEVVRIKAPPTYTNRKWMIAGNQGTRIQSIVDGTSKTLMLSEILGIPSEADARGVWTFAGMGGSTFTGRQTPNNPKPDRLPICETKVSFYEDANDPLYCKQEYTANDDVFATARSEHVDSVNIVLADASVHSITSDIDPKVWEELCTRNGAATGEDLEHNTGVPE